MTDYARGIEQATALYKEVIQGCELENARMIMAENANLRNEVDNLLDFEHLTSVAVAYAGCDECGEYKQTMLCLFAENAKLRELVKTFGMIANDAVCDYHERDKMLEQANAGACELGIEVE